MITRLISSDSRPVSLHNLDIHCALEHDLVTVNCSVESAQHTLTHDHEIFEQVPDHRCYKPNFERSASWIPRAPEFSIQLMHPLVWIKVKQTNTVYELLGLAGYVGGHGHFNNSRLECRESIYGFKKLYPELNFIFDLPEVKHVTNTLPVLVAHMTVELAEQLHAKIICDLEATLKHSFKDVMWNVWFSRLSYLTSTIILDIPQQQDDHVKLLPYVLGDKLNQFGNNLVDQVIAQLDIVTVEDFEIRARKVKQTVSQWIVDTKLSKVITKLLPTNDTVYQKILSHYITEEIISQLDQLIKKELNNEVK